MRNAIRIIAGLGLFWPIPAPAQDDDGMEMQRCIWRCLYNSPGASSVQYNQCVAQYCSETGTGTAPGPVAEWTGGLAADGITRFAGIALADGSGRGIYYMCTRSGQSYLVLYQVAGAPGSYRLRIDGIDRWLVFDRTRVELTTALHRTDPLIGALAQGSVLQVFDATGRYLLQVGLRNAQRAIGDAIGACLG